VAQRRALELAIRHHGDGAVQAMAQRRNLAALLVARLRFERLLRGSPQAEAWFDADPEAFAAAFKRYHAEVPPAAFFPQAEARLFRQWVGSRVESGRGAQ